MAKVSKSESHRIAWTALIFLLLVIGGTSLGLWWLRSQLEATGERVTFVMPGAGSVVLVAGAQQVIVDPDLAAVGVRAANQGIQSEVQEAVILRREKYTLRIAITAGKDAIEPGQLGYRLVDGGGNVLSEGEVHLVAPIHPGQTDTIPIVDPELSNAARVELRKLP